MADYQLEVRFFRYGNPEHKRTDGQCCDGGLTSCNDFCDNFFVICLKDHLHRGTYNTTTCPHDLTDIGLRLERRDIRSVYIPNNDNLVFEEGMEALQGLPNPVLFNVSGPWPVSGEFAVLGQ